MDDVISLQVEGPELAGKSFVKLILVCVWVRNKLVMQQCGPLDEK